MSNHTDQRRASSARDMAGRDINKSYVVNTYPQSAIEKLLKHLDEQINQNDTVSETMDELVRYYSRRSVDGIDGLENKLNAAGMSHVYLDAIEKKEMFSKLLYRFSMYSTAQQIFVRFLAKAENEFNSVIYPEINNISESEINRLVLDRIVNPIVGDCVSDNFYVSHNHVIGMVYWLAEQCFIRGHR